MLAPMAPRLRANGRAFAHIAQYHPELTALRRDLHAHPELGFEEYYTAARVADALRLCGVDEVHTGIAKTGVVGLVRGRSTASGRLLGLRAVQNVDIPIMAAYLMLISFLFVSINLIVDLLYAAVDPRLRATIGAH